MTTTARDLMTTGVECIREEQTLSEAARMMRDDGIGCLPICGEDEKLHGMITDRDIVVKAIAEGRDPSTVTAGELEQGSILWVDADSDLATIVEVMGREQVRRLPVLENHRLVGIISEHDLSEHLDEHQLSRFVERVYAPS